LLLRIATAHANSHATVMHRAHALRNKTNNDREDGYGQFFRFRVFFGARCLQHEVGDLQVSCFQILRRIVDEKQLKRFQGENAVFKSRHWIVDGVSCSSGLHFFFIVMLSAQGVQTIFHSFHHNSEGKSISLRLFTTHITGFLIYIFLISFGQYNLTKRTHHFFQSNNYSHYFGVPLRLSSGWRSLLPRTDRSNIVIRDSLTRNISHTHKSQITEAKSYRKELTSVSTSARIRWRSYYCQQVLKW